jgi:tRNA(Ile2) C34 agmatinyltransferase TiaS
MSDEVPICPDCGTSSLDTSGQNLWCPDCGRVVTTDEANWREAREWADRSPKRGLAATLDETDPGEVTGE